MTDIADFQSVLGESARVLALGKALSATRPGVLAVRERAGETRFLAGRLQAGPAASPARILTVPPDGGLPVSDAAEEAVAQAAPLAAAVFASRPESQAVISLRSPRLAAWGLSGRALPVRYFQMFGYTSADEVALAAPEPVDLAAALAANPQTPAVLLRDGRTLVWGPNAQRTTRLVLSLEEAAHVTALADRLGGARDYPREARLRIHASLQAQVRL
jgi:ribulose-5-phosphate 4-epimerase/fuculose-1-phosphate aldolase